jgi:hypothetical protein
MRSFLQQAIRGNERTRTTDFLFSRCDGQPTGSPFVRLPVSLFITDLTVALHVERDER